MTLIKSITSINFKSNINKSSIISINNNNNNYNNYQSENIVSDGVDLLLSNRRPQLRWWIRWWDSYSQEK
ncbi:hypothetical protein RB653_000067 [Dictyostelium firmibasis]|uniref:Uncharacterized protein n=1 Tax=Dictyostelium firmibasis TaxID=79012 RepID=A0AAN7YQF1_9MYCE